MNTKIISCFIIALLSLLIIGCAIKDKGEIISEHHKNGTELYLVNNSSSQIINFTILASEKTSIEKRYFSKKKSVLTSDSTNETAVLKLAPGARQYLAIAQISDTLNLDALDHPFSSSAGFDSTMILHSFKGRMPQPGESIFQAKGIIITTKRRFFNIVGATTE